MRFLIMIHVDRKLTAGMNPEEQKALDAKNLAEDQALLASGKLIAAGPLAEPETAAVIRNVNGRLTMIDGPYVETKEHLGGFVLVEVENREEAIAIAKSSEMAGYGAIEVRQHWSLEDWLERDK